MEYKNDKIKDNISETLQIRKINDLYCLTKPNSRLLLSIPVHCWCFCYGIVCDINYTSQWRIQGGGSLGQLPPPNDCGTPLKWRPSDKNAPFFGAYRSKNKDKKYQVETKQCFTLRWTSVFTWRTLTQLLTD